MMTKINNRFWKDFASLFSGTTIGLAAPLVLSPILTRLYAPSDFGLMAQFMAICAIAAIAITGRYELAIPLAKTEKTAFILMNLAIFLSGIASIAAFIFVILFSFLYPLPYWTLAIAPAIFGLASIQALSYWQARRGKYAIVAKARASQGIAGSVTQLGAGFVYPSFISLIVGYIVSIFTALYFLSKQNLVMMPRLHELFSRHLKAAARRYSDMPRYMVVAHLANVTSSQSPVLFIGYLYGLKYAGYFALVERVLLLPSNLIASALGDILRQDSAREFREFGHCRSVYVSGMKKLIALALPISLIAFALSPIAFPMIFGDEWKISGDFARVLSILVLFQFIFSPMSQNIFLLSYHKIDLAWQIIRLSLSISAIIIGKYIFNNIYYSIYAYCFAMCITFLMHGMLQYRVSIGYKNKTLET